MSDEMEKKRIFSVPYWGLFSEQDTRGLPVGILGVTDARCDNPACDTGCPAVSVVLTGPLGLLDIRMEPEAAEKLATLLLASANAARGGKVN